MTLRSSIGIFGVILALSVVSAKADVIGTLTNVSPGDGVTITVAPVGNPNSTTQFGTTAGVFDWQGVSGNPAGLRNTFYTFCIDLFQHVNFTSETYTGVSSALASYPVGSGSNSSTAMGATAATEIERMWTQDYGTANPQPLGGPPISNPTTVMNDNAAGFQLAVWEIVSMGSQGLALNKVGTTYFASTNGNKVFQLNSAPSAAITAANNFLADALNSAIQPTALDALYSTTLQDQTLLVPAGAALPLPSSVWGGSCLFGALLFIKWRRNKAQID